MQTYEEKVRQLQQKLQMWCREDIAVAFSGGVDSSLLLKLACLEAEQTGTTMYAVTLQTKLHPTGDLKLAKQIAAEVGAVHEVLSIDELGEAGIENNPVDRCYRCKKLLFGRALLWARERGVETVLDGTNEDDLHVYRPGRKALEELGVKSPLAEAHLTKEEVRRLAREQGMAVADRPSTPCLATRFPYGSALQYEEMQRVERGEDLLRKRGFYNVRLRVYGSLVRLEVDERDLSRVVAERGEIIQEIKSLGYTYVTLDLEGFRSGSMDLDL